MEKGQQCENAKEAYRDQLAKTNTSQTLHYSTSFPQLNDVSKDLIGRALLQICKGVYMFNSLKKSCKG